MSNGNTATGTRGERRTFFFLLAVIMVASLGFALYTFATVAELEAEDSESLIHVRDVRLNTPELAQLANRVTRGDFDTYPKLRQLATEIDASIAHLGGQAGRIISETDLGRTVEAEHAEEGEHGHAEGKAHDDAQSAKPAAAGHALHTITYTDPAVLERIAVTEAAWNEVAEQLNDVLEARTPLANVYKLAGEIEQEHIPALREALQELVDSLVENNARAEQIARVGDLILFNSHIARDLARLLRDPTLGQEAQEEAATQMIVNVANIGEILDALVSGSTELKVRRVADGPSREPLDSAVEIFFALGELMYELEERLPDLYAARESAVLVVSLGQRLEQAGLSLEESIVDLQASRFVTAEIGYYTGATGLLAMLLLGGISVSDTRRRHAETVRQKAAADATNQRNQEAILQLLDELSYLAEGDLSKQATVNEEITGAIADSVNYAIDALRSLVTSINATSEQVTGAAQQSRATTLQLAEASQQQAEQIGAASARISAMAQSMETVSREAGDSADVAQRSVEIAHQGGQVVRSSISGMDTIREQIQETSKRIKRLGESSQEIGAIVELINDIADQTNILALNAAIQAAMAGEAGRGFAVVADEVQRLAERSTGATKQIAALINTIQADTNEAVTSMERSTANVVSGAQLAADAGKALEEIESVSNQLYELIQRIAQTARNEASMAADLSTTMGGIREITTQTTAGTNETANAIGQLAELAEQLRDSVAGFKLPEAAG
ncbi:MAG TPA: methyl-accepting chemotaxis protein [Gammaproteobacteria bacterium]